MKTLRFIILLCMASCIQAMEISLKRKGGERVYDPAFKKQALACTKLTDEQMKFADSLIPKINTEYDDLIKWTKTKLKWGRDEIRKD